MSKLTNHELATMALFTALCYLGTLINFPIVVGGMKTMIHFGNIFCLVGAIILGGKKGGIVASVGMGLFDLLNGWVLYAPSTFILKFFIAFITASVYQKLKGVKGQKRLVLSFGAGMLFNVIFSPIVVYLLGHFIMGISTEAASIFVAYESAVTFINAIVAVIVATLIYNLLVKTALVKK